MTPKTAKTENANTEQYSYLIHTLTHTYAPVANAPKYAANFSAEATDTEL